MYGLKEKQSGLRSLQLSSSLILQALHHSDACSGTPAALWLEAQEGKAMGDEGLGAEEPMGLDSQKAASTDLRVMAQHCPDSANPKQTHRDFLLLFTFSVISVFSFGFHACLHHYFQASSWSTESQKVLPVQRKAARRGITKAAGRRQQTPQGWWELAISQTMPCVQIPCWKLAAALPEPAVCPAWASTHTNG